MVEKREERVRSQLSMYLTHLLRIKLWFDCIHQKKDGLSLLGSVELCQPECDSSRSKEVECILKLKIRSASRRFPAYSRVGKGNLVLRHGVSSPLTTEFWRHCVLSGGTLRRTLHLHHSEEMEI